MSTRATIKIVKKGRKPVWMYHHCDGYPDGVGVELLVKHASEHVLDDAHHGLTVDVLELLEFGESFN